MNELLKIIDQQIENAWDNVTVLQKEHDWSSMHQWWLGHARAWEQASRLIREQQYMERGNDG